MAKNIRKYYGDDGVTLLKTEETQITSEANDVNKVVKKITAYKTDGKVDFVEETEDFYNAKTGEKIIPNKNTNTSTNSNTGNKVTVTAFIPYYLQQNLLLVCSLVVLGGSGLMAEVLLLEARVRVLEHCSGFGISLPLLDQLVELQRVL